MHRLLIRSRHSQKIDRIALRIAIASTIFSGLGPLRLLSIFKFKKMAR